MFYFWKIWCDYAPLINMLYRLVAYKHCYQCILVQKRYAEDHQGSYNKCKLSEGTDGIIQFY